MHRVASTTFSSMISPRGNADIFRAGPDSTTPKGDFMISGRIHRGLAMATLAAFACLPLGAQAAGVYVDAAIGQSSINGIDQQELDALMIEVGEDAFDSFTLNDSS